MPPLAGTGSCLLFAVVQMERELLGRRHVAFSLLVWINYREQSKSSFALRGSCSVYLRGALLWEALGHLAQQSRSYTKKSEISSSRSRYGISFGGQVQF